MSQHNPSTVSFPVPQYLWLPEAFPSLYSSPSASEVLNYFCHLKGSWEEKHVDLHHVSHFEHLDPETCCVYRPGEPQLCGFNSQSNLKEHKVGAGGSFGKAFLTQACEHKFNPQSTCKSWPEWRGLVKPELGRQRQPDSWGFLASQPNGRASTRSH